MRFSAYGLRELVIFSILPLLGVIYGLYLGNWILCLASLPLLWFVCNFFRDPQRPIPPQDNVLVSPADGQVTAIEKAQTDWLGPCWRVSVFMNVFSVHVNRAPVSGIVKYVQHVPGKFLNALSGEAALHNERQLIGIEGDDGRKYMVVQIAGLIARNIVCPLKVGDRVEKGQRFGMIKFGSRADLYVQRDAPWTPRVTVGQWVKAGQDILGEIELKES